MSCAYLPGYSEARNATERFISVQTEQKYYDIKTGVIARLGRKVMGEQMGLCPMEEVFHLSSVDPGVIVPIGCNDNAPVDDTQKGIDCFGNEIDIETVGGSADSDLCRSLHRGSFALGVDVFSPEFYSYERRFPTICVDAAMASPKEVKQTLRAIQQDGPRLVLSDLDYLLWDLYVKKGTGNTSIARDVKFGADVGLTSGQFPYAPQSYLNHRFMKRIQEITMADPDNWGKRFYVEASSLQISKAIEDDQRIFGIERRASGNEVPDPYRREMTVEYDGIYYVKKEMADYVGLVERTNAVTFIRPRLHVHQAGSVHGVVTRPNYELTRGCTIQCGGNTLTKYEVAHWYVEDALSFVPFMAPGNVPTNGKEAVKDHVYATVASFKTYDVESHAVEMTGNCKNDRGQFQQFGMMTRFGLFNRPDKINFGSILMQPVHQVIELQTNTCPEDIAACIPETAEIAAADRGAPFSDGCEICEGSTGTTGGGSELSAIPTAESPNPALSSTVPGTFRIFDTEVVVTEGVHTSAQFCVERVGGSLGALDIDYTTTAGTAIAATNYTTTAGTLSWADGESGRKCVSVPILDADIAAAVAFTFNISAPGAAVITAPTAANGTINPTPTCATDECAC